MEILRNTLPIVTFNHPAANTTVTSVAWEKDGIIGAASATPSGPTTTTATLPFQTTDGELRVTWSFTIQGSGSYSYDEYFDVVTPLISLAEVRKIVDDAEFDDEEIKNLESSVRHIVQAYTGQTFGLENAVYEVRGGDSNSLQLPARLIKVNSFNGVENAGAFFEVTGDGWYMSLTGRFVPPVRADYYGLHQHRGGVIHNPNNVNPKFLRNYVYTIDGQWGWKSIPNPVQEAARLLVGDYASEDATYRDRYLTSMTAADWRIQFESAAFTKTGNARADLLLSEFVLTRGWVVI